MTYGEFREACLDYYNEVYDELKQIYEDGEYHRPTLLDGELLALRRVLNWMDEINVKKIHINTEALSEIQNDINNLKQQLEKLKED